MLKCLPIILSVFLITCTKNVPFDFPAQPQALAWLPAAEETAVSMFLPAARFQAGSGSLAEVFSAAGAGRGKPGSPETVSEPERLLRPDLD
jgi:hypothetical protein